MLLKAQFGVGRMSRGMSGGGWRAQVKLVKAYVDKTCEVQRQVSPRDGRFLGAFSRRARRNI